ncbi:hypothetical protein GCM10023225_03370 [Kineococcus glutinatus]|uniref:Uncharacterized protein n=1 Tax=Kineococcus glutinatus TaxID=1070872 RepID=A0ABP9H7V4_9ACTN
MLVQVRAGAVLRGGTRSLRLLQRAQQPPQTSVVTTGPPGRADGGRAAFGAGRSLLDDRFLAGAVEVTPQTGDELGRSGGLVLRFVPMSVAAVTSRTVTYPSPFAALRARATQEAVPAGVVAAREAGTRGALVTVSGGGSAGSGMWPR